jgi:hypothetical protein
MTDILRFVPGQFFQGTEEAKAYTANVGNLFTAPTAACCVIKEGTTDRSASNLQAAASAGPTISTCFIKTPCIVGLRVGVDYRVEIKFEQGGEVLERYFMVTGVT